MNELLYFKLRSCPYCIAVDNWIKELIGENPEFDKIEIKIVDEQLDREFADKFDYYYVPTFFFDGRKLHEGAATKEKIKKVFDEVIFATAKFAEAGR